MNYVRSRAGRRFGTSALTLLAAAAFALPVQAELIGYEPFDYGLGSFEDVAEPASTAISNLVAANYFLYTIVSDSIAFGNVPVAGNKLDIEGGGTEMNIELDVTPGGPFDALLDGNGRIGADGTTLYVSFLFQVAGAAFDPAGSQCGLIFRDETDANKLTVGQNWAASTFRIQGNTNTAFNMDTEPHLVVLKIQFQAGDDIVTTYVDPILGADEAAQTPAASDVTRDVSFTKINIKGQGSNVYVMDELRFATTYDDATGGLLSAAPNAPSELNALAISDSAIELDWTDTSPNETGFRIYRSTQMDTGFAEIGTVGADVTEYSDTGLNSATTYYYEVVAYNGGGESAPATANASTLEQGLSLPDAPSGLTATVSGPAAVDLAWTNHASNAYGVRVYRSLGNDTDFREIAMLDGSLASWTDRFAPSEETIYYLVRSLNDVGESLDSNVASATTDPAPLSGDNYVWWEAEDYDTTTFPNTFLDWLSPNTDELRALVSNEDGVAYFPGGLGTSDWSFEITYKVNVPETGTYNFYARRIFSYGPFTWEFDTGQSGTAPRSLLLINELPYRQFFPLAWVNIGAIELEAGERTLTLTFAAEDWPAADPEDEDGVDNGTNQLFYDAFLLSQLPFSPSGKLRPGQTLGLADEGFFPWEPGSDPHSEDALLDLSYLNEDRAGETGFITRDGDKFYRGDGERIRFWSAGIGSTNDLASLELQAKHYAKRGINMVRWHQSIDDRSPTNPSISNVSDLKIDELHATVAAFAEEGIYTKVSYFFVLGFRIREQWGLEGYTSDWIDNNDVAPFGVMFYNDAVKEGFKDWIFEMMTRPNPYDDDNSPLKDETAVSIIEIQNEDNLFFFTFTPDNVPPEQWDLAGEKFGDFLVAKYGSLEAAVQAWGGGERANDRPEEGIMEVQAAGALRVIDPNSPVSKRRIDQTEWMATTQRDFWAEIRDYYENTIGAPHVLTATNWKTADAATMRDMELWTYTAAGVIDLHNYLSPYGSNTATSFSITTGDNYTDLSVTQRPARLPVAYKQVRGHPSVISEFAWVNPTKLHAEGPLMISAYGSLGDVDAIIWFASNDLTYSNTLERWPLNTPSVMGQYPATGLAYREFYIDDAPTVVLENRTTESMYRLEDSIIVQGTGFDPVRDGEIEPIPGEGAISMTASMVGRVEVGYGTDTDFVAQAVADLQAPETDQIRSITGELVTDYNLGLFTTDNEMIQGASGYLGEIGPVDLTDVTIDLDNDFGAVTVVSLDETPLAQSSKVLVQTGTFNAPYGYEESPTTVFVSGQPRDGFQLDKLGGAPMGVEYVRGEVLLKGFAGATVKYLDPHGYLLADGIGIDQGSDLRVLLPSTSIYTVVEREATADSTPEILTKAVDTAFVDEAFSEVLVAAGGDPALTWTALDALPTGLSLATNGTLSGTPEEPGAYTFTAQVEDADGDTDSQVIAILVYGEGPAENVNPFADLPVENDQSKVSPWFGKVWDGQYPYIYSENHQWAYMVGLPSGIYIYDLRDPELLWLFTQEAYYPWIYSYVHDEWFYFFTDSGILGAPRWFHDPSGTLGTDGYFRLPADDE